MTSRGWQTWLIAIALLLKALIPAGYMLSDGAKGSGGVEIVICTASGSKLISAGEADGAPRKPSLADAACPFALLGQLAVPAWRLPRPVFEERPVPLLHASDLATAGIALPSWNARAPPA